MGMRQQSINQSINQSKHISIAPYVASESEAHKNERETKGKKEPEESKRKRRSKERKKVRGRINNGGMCPVLWNCVIGNLLKVSWPPFGLPTHKKLAPPLVSGVPYRALSIRMTSLSSYEGFLLITAITPARSALTSANRWVRFLSDAKLSTLAWRLALHACSADDWWWSAGIWS